jgi:hypothetical protein
MILKFTFWDSKVYTKLYRVNGKLHGAFSGKFSTGKIMGKV